jgi:3-oxoacyl-[acyl-carrier protein] reductase
MNERELSGRVAVITGVGRRAGLGARISCELARAGAKLALFYHRDYDAEQTWGQDAEMPDALLQQLAPWTEAYAKDVDLSDPDAASAVFSEVAQRFGAAHILVNNACYWQGGDLARVDAAQLDRHYGVNTRAPVLLCREFVRQLPLGTAGRIINISSGQGHAPMPGELAYAVTKAALDALSLTLAAELRGRGITVNAVDPGPTDTGWMTASTKAALLANSPSGALAVPDDTARTVRLLASDAASAISGQIVRVHPSADGSASGSAPTR